MKSLRLTASAKPLCAAVLLAALTGFPQERTSTHYRLSTETCGDGRGQASSAHYQLDHVSSSVAGYVESVDYAARFGYVGLLLDATTLGLSATLPTVPETQSRQLSAFVEFDDQTSLIATPFVTWSVAGGPLLSVSSGGLATSTTVYQDTPAYVGATFGSLSNYYILTVIDTLPDDYGSYAGDNLPDWWQAQYFGLNNPNAVPGRDPDHDGLDNQFEYIAGLVPTNAASKFSFFIANVTNQPNQKEIVFSPRIAGRTYTVVAATTLANPATNSLAGYPTIDNGNTRTVTDTNASGSMRFYRVNISLP